MITKKILIEDYKPSNIIINDEDDNDDEQKNLVSTPFGIYRLNDSMNPIKQFNLKIVNINFPLTKGMRAVIDNLRGIEVFVVISQYKFIIGIGKAFEEKDIIDNLRYILSSSSDIILYETDVDNVKLNDLVKKLSNVSKFWIIYALPNGSMDYSNIDETKSLEAFTFYKEAQKYSKGQIVVSEALKEKIYATSK